MTNGYASRYQHSHSLILDRGNIAQIAPVLCNVGRGTLDTLDSYSYNEMDNTYSVCRSFMIWDAQSRCPFLGDDGDYRSIPLFNWLFLVL